MQRVITIKHPCFDKKAGKDFGRIHLPVAPKCNISCNYCSRKYACVNENRPGVAREVLSPEKAAERFRSAIKKMPYISTVGIAGPGDSLANPETTLSTIRLIKRDFPETDICLSTNGLMLSDLAEELLELKVGYITITINSLDIAIAEKIYRWVFYKGKIYQGREGAELLLEKQREGLLKLKDTGVLIKINTVYIPGINEGEGEKIAKYAKGTGAVLMNIMPLIPAPGSAFEKMAPPLHSEVDLARQRVRKEIDIMSHCRQCRSDAVGRIGEDSYDDLS